MQKHLSSANSQDCHVGQGTKHTSKALRSDELESLLVASQQREAEALARVAELEAQLEVQQTTRGTLAAERLDTLLEVCSVLLVVHNVETLLDLLIQKIPTLFPGTSNALLFLADTQADELMLRAASNKLTANLVIPVGQGVAGQAFLAPRAMLMSGPLLEETWQSLEVAHLHSIQALLETWPPASALLAPLRVGEQRLGALVLYGGTHAHLFHPRDLPFVQTLADLAAVAISEAQQRAHAEALQRDLTHIQSAHAETQARLGTAQAQLLQSAKLAAVGELAASVAHEINNPLYAARNSLYLVEQDTPPNAPQRAFLEIAQTELGRIARIITRMRDFYRPTREELSPTDVNKILRETIELVQTHLRHNQISATHKAAPSLPAITAHADQLRQVFLNLLLNACDAMPNGGQLLVQTECFSESQAQWSSVEIRITDTGTGIPDEHLPHLFEPFYTTKPQGTGLGLAISAHIVTQHDGRIGVESQMGQGTTFTIVLPVKES